MTPFSHLTTCFDCATSNRIPAAHPSHQGRCQMAAPELELLAQEMSGQALILKVDTEAEPALAAQFRIQSIPNFHVVYRGNLIHQQAGLAPRATMRSWLTNT